MDANVVRSQLRYRPMTMKYYSMNFRNVKSFLKKIKKRYC